MTTKELGHERNKTDLSGAVDSAGSDLNGSTLADRHSVGDGGLHAGRLTPSGRRAWLPDNPRKRGEEKRRLVLEWICRYHYSNVTILMALLGLKHYTNTSYFTKLVNDGLLKRVSLSTLRRPILMLTSAGHSLVGDMPVAAIYNLDERRISTANARHTLAVQLAVVRRKALWESVIPERLMRERGKKIPDALLISGARKNALEVELNYKSKLKIYLGFADHARAFRDSLYSGVEYVFTDAAMCTYYQGLFDEKKWPVFRWNQESRHYDKEKELFLVDALAGLRDAVSFTVEELSYD